MAANVFSYFCSGSRAKILIAATAFFLVTIIFSFHGRIADSGAWSTVGSYIGGGSEKAQDDVAHLVATTPVGSHRETSSVVVETATASPTIATTGASSSSPAASSTQQHQVGDDICRGFPDTSDVLVVMKTGATEAYEKLPIHFMSTLKCVKDFVIFSDMKMNMAGYEIHDVLDQMNPEYVANNNDFDLYRQLQNAYQQHQDPRDLVDGQNGWNLDKYKFVPMLDRTWKYRTDAKWYVFIEADTFIHWENTLEWLKSLDPEDPYYLGSPTFLDIEFAHGGTGYIISHGAMKKAIGDQPGMLQKYEEEVVGFCCGDRMIAKVLLDQGIKLTKVWPMFNGENQLTFPYNRKEWCQPVMTMHHMTAQEVSKMWNFELKRRREGVKDPMLWKDVFNEFTKSNLKPVREDWENFSHDQGFTTDPDAEVKNLIKDGLTKLQEDSAKSPENCKELCESDDNCFQWQHVGNVCHIHFSIKMGISRPSEEGRNWVSGWNFKKINSFRQEMQECHNAVDWHVEWPS